MIACDVILSEAKDMLLAQGTNGRSSPSLRMEIDDSPRKQEFLSTS